MKKQKESLDPLQALIKEVQKDQAELQEHEEHLLMAKQAKQIIIARLKDYRKDLSVLVKYASDEQKAQIEALGFVNPPSGNTLNPTAQIALDIMTQKKELTNDTLYKVHYLKAVPKGLEPLNYTQFNIKIRPLFNRELLIREKGTDPNSSKTDVIRLKG